MREIKFRAWDKTKQRFTIDNDMLAVTFNGDVIHASDIGIVFRNDLELMQYTGLKDKNGVDIYEGDVILTADDLRKQVVGNWKPKMRVVEWTDNKEYKTGFNLGRAQHGKCEVIGNVYENSELLKAIERIESDE